LEDERNDAFKRVQIDEQNARQNIASMINENRGRIHNFDIETQIKKKNAVFEEIDEDELEVDKFDKLDGNVSKTVGPPKSFLGKMKDY
jgi:hypothetical protein